MSDVRYRVGGCRRTSLRGAAKRPAGHPTQSGSSKPTEGSRMADEKDGYSATLVRHKMPDYPTPAEVERATVEELLRWNRWLPTAHSPKETFVIDSILGRLDILRRTSPLAYIEASRAVGWDF
jgi:hypothetical protein